MVTHLSSDARIREDVLAELSWDSRLDATSLGVQVTNGVVTLTGSVKSYAEKLAAQEAAHRVESVRDVANDLQVVADGAHARSDTQIARAVRQALEWDVQVPHERIDSTVDDGWVTLTGDVHAWSERADAERAIRFLAGVRGVTNQIDVKPENLRADEIRRAIARALERRAEREAKHVRVEVRNGKVTLTGRVQSWNELQAILGTVEHAPGVRSIEDNLRIEP